MTNRYEILKTRWEFGWITKETLQGWVDLEQKYPGKGITQEEYIKITGEKYL